ncbi:unnamed protein product [Trichobilharzia regenti]|nr:unnamed protein product [Trichobilharzia regenti]
MFIFKQDWEEHYIQQEFFNFLKTEITMADVEQPCPDVFWFPLLTETFCKQLIEEMENFGEWSNGDNHDPRLEGGYENVPTRDIHMRQVDWEEHWQHVLGKYIYPIQKKLYEGYEDRVTSLFQVTNFMNFQFIYPGRVTHLHEGLPTTKGTRYIFVTFVNP